MADITLSYKDTTIKEISVSGTTTLNTAGTYCEDDITLEYTKPSGTYQAKTNINPTTSSQTITADSGYDALSSVQINAMPTGSARPASSISATGATISINENAGTITLNKTVSNTPQVSAGYIDSGTAGNTSINLTSGMVINDSDSLTVSGATVTAPWGYYPEDTTKTIASGTEGTPVATKGTVSNHAVSVTPSVTNSAGYISGGTKTGTAVSVSASELVSGTKSISANGTGIDVTNYASVNVAVPTANVESNKNVTLEGGPTIIVPSSGYDAMEQVTANVPEIQLPPSMPPSFLNTDWVINENPSLNALIGMDVIINYGEYTADYYLDPYDGTELYFVESQGDMDSVLVYSSVEGWENSLYRRITIVGGSSISNPTFVAWLHNNAVPVGTSADFNYNFFPDAGIVEINVVNSGYLSNSNTADIVLPSQGHPAPAYYSFGNTTGKLTFSHYQPSGFTLGGMSFGSYQLPVKSAQTYTPTTTNQVINYAQWLTGSQTIKGDANLVAGNIKKNVSIFGVTGTYEGGGVVATLLHTYSLGTLSTTATSATSANKTVSIPNYNYYDLIILDISVDTPTNNRHTSTVSTIYLTGTSNAKNIFAVGGNKLNSKLNSSGTVLTRQSTTAYGVYAYSAEAASGTLNVPIYYRYQSNYSGTINGAYTARAYGINLIDLIGG